MARRYHEARITVAPGHARRIGGRATCHRTPRTRASA